MTNKVIILAIWESSNFSAINCLKVIDLTGLYVWLTDNPPVILEELVSESYSLTYYPTVWGLWIPLNWWAGVSGLLCIPGLFSGLLNLSSPWTVLVLLLKSLLYFSFSSLALCKSWVSWDISLLDLAKSLVFEAYWRFNSSYFLLI